jgi:hypothetical protein
VVVHGMEGNPIQEWLTYAEAGERLGVSPEAVRAKAIRKAWRRQAGNDGKARILVPPEILHASVQQPLHGRSTPVVQQPINGRSSPVRKLGDQGMLTALREHISTLRDDNERLRGDLAAEKERSASAAAALAHADRATTELKTDIERLTAELAGERAELAAERTRADRATTELKGNIARLESNLAVERMARRADQNHLAAERAARQADQEHAAARRADQEQQLATARAAADKATAELVDLARRLAAIAETQAAAETAEAEPEPPRRSAMGRAWRWFLRN